MNFTGIRDLDLEILKKLDDAELGKICSTNKYFRELCKNEDFWRNRTVERFSKYLGNLVQINKYKLKYESTWRLYYISLINFLESLYQRRNYDFQRDDFEILTRLSRINFERLISEINNNFHVEKWKEFLKMELSVPNNAFYLWDYIENDDKVYKIVDYILSVNDRRINPNDSLVHILNADDFDVNTVDIRKRLSERILKDERIVSKSVLKAIKKFSQRLSANAEELSMLNFYLDFVKNNNGVEQLREIIRNITPENDQILNHIYKYLDAEIDDVFPKIYKLLQEQSLTKLEQDKIIGFVKNIRKIKY